MDLVLTGASRGIGRALALGLPPSIHLYAVARDAAALEELQRARPQTTVLAADLSSLDDTRRVAATLAPRLRAGAIVVHNAGIWPARKELVPWAGRQLERAFVVNCLAPLALLDALAPQLSRVLVVGAGLMVKARFDENKTPTGEDFHWLRTYANTKLAFALATRDWAASHPDVDTAVIHPGVVRTSLGARAGLVGWLLDRMKRSWETPELCAARLVRFLERKERWSSPGEARWFFEGTEQPWPLVANDVATRDGVRRALSSFPP